MRSIMLNEMFLFKYLDKQNCTLSIFLNTISVIQQVILILHNVIVHYHFIVERKILILPSSHETSIFFSSTA